MRAAAAGGEVGSAHQRSASLTSKFLNAALSVQALQAFDDGVQPAGHDLLQWIILVDAVVGAAVLREIIRADAFIAVARADHGLASLRALGVLLLHEMIAQTREQDASGAVAIFVLAALVTHADRDARGFVLELDGARDLVDVLAARTACTAHMFDHVLVPVDLDVKIFG